MSLLLASRTSRNTTPSLDLSTGGTFSRASAAYYYLSAPTDGSTAFLASASAGVRRSADTRGDGIGASLLMEKAATNRVLRSRDISNAAWTAGTATVTANQANGPDGTMVASRINAASGQYSSYQASLGGAARTCLTLWCRAVSGSVNAQADLFEGGGSPIAPGLKTVTTTYGRLESPQLTIASTYGTVPIDGRSQTGSGGQGATAQDVYVDLVQIDEGYYPTSPIVTAGATVTRPADFLSYNDGSYPPEFLNGFRLVFAPDASSAEISNGSETFMLLSCGAAQNLQCYTDGSGNVVFEFDYGGLSITTPTVTFSRGQALTITARASTGELIIAGATTGNGTYTGTVGAMVSSGVLYVGRYVDDSANVTGRYLDAAGIGKPSIVAA